MDYLVPGRHTTHDVAWYKENTMGETTEGISIDQNIKYQIPKLPTGPILNAFKLIDYSSFGTFGLN